MKTFVMNDTLKSTTTEEINIKELVIESLLSDYTEEECNEMLEKAKLEIEGHQVKVTYDNGVTDLFELKTSYYLEHQN